MSKEDFTFQNNFPHLVECKLAIKPFCSINNSLLPSCPQLNLNPSITYSFCFSQFCIAFVGFILLYKNYLKSLDGFSGISERKQL